MRLRLLLALSLLVTAQLTRADRGKSERPAGWPIAETAAWTAIARATNSGSGVTVPVIEVLGRPVSRAARPELRVESSRWNGSLQAVEFRLRCVERLQCGAFLVRVSSSAPEFRHAQSLFPGSARGNGAANPPEIAASLLARPGRAAKMAWRGAGFRIWLPVMCLEGGGLGQRIRVRDRSGRRNFLARVTGPGELEAISQ